MTKLISEKLFRERHFLAAEMKKVVQAEAKTENWHYKCYVTPELLINNNAEFRIDIEGVSESQRMRCASYGLKTVRLYHKLFEELIRKFDNGEIRNPWDDLSEENTD